MPHVRKGVLRLFSCHSSVPIQDRCVNLRAVASLPPTPKTDGNRRPQRSSLGDDPKSRPPSVPCSRTNEMSGEVGDALKYIQEK